MIGQAPEQAGSPGPTEATPEHREAFSLVVGRTMEALAQDPRGLDAALKADPVAGAVQFGTSALWTVVDAADQAGRPMPFEVIVAAGIQTIKALGAIANEKGYLPDESIEGFLVQAYQQAIGKFAKLDADAGKLTDESMAQLKQFFDAQSQQGGALASMGAS